MKHPAHHLAFTAPLLLLAALSAGCDRPIQACLGDCPPEDGAIDDLTDIATCDLEDTIVASATCTDGVRQPGEICNVFGYGGFGSGSEALVSSRTVPRPNSTASDRFIAYDGGQVLVAHPGGDDTYWPMPAPWDHLRFTASGDFNSDGIVDVAARSGELSPRARVLLIGSDAQYIGDVVLAEEPGMLGPDAVDWDGDGHLDAIVILPYEAHPTNVILHRGDGAGGFVPQPLFGLEGDLSVRAFVALGPDGIADDLVRAAPQGGLELRLTTQTGPVSRHVDLGSFAAALALATADLDEDGDDDIVALVEESAHHTSRVAVLLQTPGDEGPAFAIQQLPVHCGAVGLAIGDLNADGWLDIATTSPGEPYGKGTMRMGDGAGSFEDMITPYLASDIHDLGIADIDGDGLAEMTWSNYSDRMLECAGNMP